MLGPWGQAAGQSGVRRAERWAKIWAQLSARLGLRARTGAQLSAQLSARQGLRAGTGAQLNARLRELGSGHSSVPGWDPGTAQCTAWTGSWVLNTIQCVTPECQGTGCDLTVARAETWQQLGAGTARGVEH